MFIKYIANFHHKDQMYGNVPYFEHLEAVANSVKSAYPGDYAAEALAWVHDILEDTECTIKELEHLGTEVCEALHAITFDPDIETRSIYIQRVKANPLAMKVKIHDTMCNLRACIEQANYRMARKYNDQLQELLK